MAKGFRSNFSFGELAAERDPLLLDHYFDNGDYEAISSRTNPKCFLIGRTGSGKSAAFRFLESEYPQKVVRIDPESLALPYISNLDVLPQLMSLGVHLEPFLKALWKHVFLVEILRHRYAITSQDQKRNIIANLKKKYERDPSKLAAISYLDEFGDKYWCETHERVKYQANLFVKKIKAIGGIAATVFGRGVNGSAELDQTTQSLSESENIQKYQRVVNEVQVPRLNEMISILNSDILDDQHFTYLIIDDLDKEWVEERFANLLIRCLFQAVIDMQKVQNLKILVALRTNIFRQLNYGEFTRGGQEEKFRGLSLNIRWTAGDLRSLLSQRAEGASNLYKLEQSKTLVQMLPRANKQAGDPVEYILLRTLLRPRDAILYLNECTREASGKERIAWSDIRSAEVQYSKDRLDALRDEWKDPYLDIDRVFAQFRRCATIMSQQELTPILDNIAMLLADAKFRGQQWLNEACVRLFEAGSISRKWADSYGGLVKILLDTSFLGIGKGQHNTYSYEKPDIADYLATMDESTTFAIHPAFRAALDIREPQRSTTD